MDLIVFIEQHWTFITWTLAIIVGYAKLQFSITELSKKDCDIEERLASVELDMRSNTKDFTEIKVSIARIEATLIGLHEAINKIK